MAKKSAAKRIARLEGIAVGMGFLLTQLKSRYGHDFSVGLDQQVTQAIRDYRQLEQSLQQRAAAQSATKEPA